jgi:hypothetical protein
MSERRRLPDRRAAVTFDLEDVAQLRCDHCGSGGRWSSPERFGAAS